MSERILYPYEPDPLLAIPPGETLQEMLEERGMSQTELALRMGRPVKTINEIIRGKTAITAETALQLERVFTVPVQLWLNLEQSYREALARQVEDEALQMHQAWVKNFPIAKMRQLGWLPTGQSRHQLLVDLLQFFGIAHPDSFNDLWEACLVDYRRTTAYSSSDYALAAWLRQGEIEAQAVYTEPYDAAAFRQLLRHECRALTLETDLAFIMERLTALCASVGTAVVFVPQIDGARVSGAARWLHKDKALIQLSLRYKTNDYFWFSFFHEAGHILLHGKRDIFIEYERENGEAPSQKEREADNFARHLLIPQSDYESFVFGIEMSEGYFSTTVVKEFAERSNIAPGIVVGRLQHDGHVKYSHLNKLKIPFDWSDIAMEAV